MKPINRRSFLNLTAAGLAAAPVLVPSRARAANAPWLRIGICDWNLHGQGRPALEKAAGIGLDGVQVSPRGAADVLSYATPEEQAMYRKAMADTGMQIASAGLNVTNRFPLASDPRAPAWLTQTIDAASALGCTTTLLAFFGKGALKDKNGLKKAEIDSVVGRLKEAAPYARTKGIYLGLENTLSAVENMAIMDRVGSEYVQVYYDIANSTGNGYDVPGEIRMLKGRICEFHFKNPDGVFGQAGIALPPIVEAINEIDYRGWIVLERSAEKDYLAYFKKNADYIRTLFQG